jgi:transposase
VNLICVASFIAAVGSANRFLTSRKLVAYLGLDPRVKPSGEDPARSGRISQRGSVSARCALVESAWSVVLQPDPRHAFYERTKGRRGHGRAIVATALKLAVLFWCMLTRGARTTPTNNHHWRVRVQPAAGVVWSGRARRNPQAG